MIMLCQFSFSQDLTKYVNPFIGTSNDGNTYPGVVMPWGMVSVSPFNARDTIFVNAKFPSSAYVSKNKYLSGFSNINLSGVGCPDMGVVNVMPTSGELQILPIKYATLIENEVATPGYYKTNLVKHGILAELSATTRTSIMRFTFPQGKGNILFNVGLGLTNINGGSVRFVNETEIEGARSVGGFCGTLKGQIIYFVGRISKKPAEYGVWNGQRLFERFNRETMGDNIGAYLKFNTLPNEIVEVKLGFSYVSIQNARQNLDVEQPKWEFENVRKQCQNAWNTQLSKIEVEGGTLEDKSIFYTGLYHILQHPNVFQDVNGEYPAMMSDKIAKIAQGNRYSVFSLWDTYRNVHPFLSLVYPKQQSDMVKSMLAMYDENGWLPKWELASMETFVMVGDPASIVISDSYFRGIKDFDINKAYQAIYKAATTSESENVLRPGLDAYLKYGYIPMDIQNIRKVWGPVSTTLEYAISDWNISQLAQSLGKTADYQLFGERSKCYINLFDKKYGLMRPKNADGSWFEPFEPAYRGKSLYPGAPGFVEGNSWQYSFMVAHDINNLKKLIGGDKPFVEMLQRCFDENYFEMSNEPDIAYPYLFNYCKGNEWRTQLQVRKLLRKNYNTSSGGINGNDDCGTMSAWAVFAMMGFYPDCPGNMNYQITSPVFSKITIHLDNDYYQGKTFVIEAPKSNDENIYIQKMQLNGKPYSAYTLKHADIVKGGILKIELDKNKK